MGPTKSPGLYKPNGDLDRELFDAKAWAVLEVTTAWLREVGRALYLPIDLIVVLLNAGHAELGEQLARAARGAGGTEDVLPDIERLARRIERETDGEPRLHVDRFSLGFMGILDDALNWAREAGWERISESDLVRVVRWRAEVQESASVRWAIRQLAAPGGEHLFDADGVLKHSAFVDRAWGAMQESMQLAARSGMPFLGTPHLVAVLCSVRESVLWRAAEASGVDPRKLREELLRIVGVRSPAQPVFLLSRRTMTPRLVRMLTFASERAGAGGRIQEVHLVEGFLEDGGSSLELIKALGLESEICSRLGEPRVLEGAAVPLAEHRAEEQPNPASATPMLDLLGRDMSREAELGRLPTIIGRDRELHRVINVLLRREQRNPLLTGEAGVGKTALAAALAMRIHDGNVPRRLLGHRVVEINGASLIGGTSYRGDLEARIKALLTEAADKVILFIDEAHAVFAPRSGSGQPAEVPNHFKAALASGDIAVVAATTESEYHRWIEQDPALKRRFERITVSEPTEALAQTILSSLVPGFEEDYEVEIHEEAVEAALELSVRFIPEQRLPDKAKKLLMDAAISSAMAASHPDVKEGGPRNTFADRPRTGAGPAATRPQVTRETVAEQVALKTGLPLDRLVRGEQDWWVGLDRRLSPYVVGQEAAVAQTARALVTGRLRSGMRGGPQAVFLFIGPPGVGKRDLAMALAEELYADQAALVRLNMTDFQEAHALSRLIGSPPGYVGYSDEDSLVTPLRRRPSSVVLLEDFDRAHPQVQDRFMALFDEGTITDTHGMKADASHAVFVLTVTTASEEEGGAIGFSTAVVSQDDRSQASRVLERHDEVLARRMRGVAYEPILFRSATSDGGALLGKLFEQRLARFRASLLQGYGLQLDIGADYEEEIRQEALALRDARELERLFTRAIIEPVTDQLMCGIEGNTLYVSDPANDTGRPAKVANTSDFAAVAAKREASEGQPSSGKSARVPAPEPIRSEQ
jgi:ATP-dependent Clp protease ATP-binding subunit ClpC